jgi:hypothetical protein
VNDKDGLMDQYTIRFMTMPDETIIDFVPGIGITRFSYSHHGSAANAEMKLSEIKSLVTSPKSRL